MLDAAAVGKFNPEIMLEWPLRKYPAFPVIKTALNIIPPLQRAERFTGAMPYGGIGLGAIQALSDRRSISQGLRTP